VHPASLLLELADPATNITYGVAYLARAWRLADGDLCRALMKYRAGHRQERMSPLSKKYCALAKAYLEANGLDDPTSDRLSHATTQLATR
jgi:soluble lytic murein transglycosylase-like protein